MNVSAQSAVKVADEVWIVVALLQRENPERADFSIDEIMERARVEGIYGTLRPGVYVHVIQHCVANRQPSPGRYRMLFETSPGRRRLYRPGDNYHPGREGSKTVPDAEDIPAAYRDLVDWYRDWCARTAKVTIEVDPLLGLLGSGRRLWADEHADKYVHRLREGWE